MWLLWLRALYYLCFCCLFRPFSSSTVAHKRKGKHNFRLPPACGVVPENHFRAQSEWFFSVDFSNRFRLIGVFSLILLSHTHIRTHSHTATPTHTHCQHYLSCILYLKASHTHPHQNFDTQRRRQEKKERKRRTKLTKMNYTKKHCG